MNNLTETILFDWGDTLMIDFPGVPGKMCNWETVQAVDGAYETLMFLSQRSKIYIATGAAQSTEKEIKNAFKRVGLHRYITGYFCKSNLGVEKGSPEFLPLILSQLGIEANLATMVGDSLQKDIEPAIKIGINAILLSENRIADSHNKFKTITSLKELCF